jgi:hypothetical protein
MDVIEQFRVRMNIAAPGLDIGLQIGDAIDDRHGYLGVCFWLIRLSSTQNAFHPTAPKSPSWPGLSRPSTSE